MTDIANLIEKRRELARLVETLQEQLDQAWADLTHLDGALRLLGKDLDPETIRPKRRYRRSPYFGHNEALRLVLATLRNAVEPIGIEEIARRVMLAKGFDPRDVSLRAAIREGIRPIITRLRKHASDQRVRSVFWKFLRTLPLPGMAMLVSPFIIGLGYIMDGYHFIMLGLPPWLIQLIGALLFVLSMIGLYYRYWISTQIPIKGVSPLSVEEKQRQPVSVAPAGTISWWPLALSFIIIVILISAIVYILLEARSAEMRLVLYPFQTSPPGDPARAPTIGSTGLLINFAYANPNNDTVSGMAHNFHYENTDHILSAHEEDAIMKNVLEEIETPKEGGQEIYPHNPGGWFTTNDRRLDVNSWREIMNGGRWLYVFVGMKYLVNHSVYVTEWCSIISQGYPAMPYCRGHNRSYLLK
jgi:hypothetical protein